MKHVIVIETVDPSEGGEPIHPYLQNNVEEFVEDLLGESCVVRGRWNVESAIAAVHEMYGAPEWKP